MCKGTISAEVVAGLNGATLQHGNSTLSLHIIQYSENIYIDNNNTIQWMKVKSWVRES